MTQGKEDELGDQVMKTALIVEALRGKGLWDCAPGADHNVVCCDLSLTTEEN